MTKGELVLHRLLDRHEWEIRGDHFVCKICGKNGGRFNTTTSPSTSTSTTTSTSTSASTSVSTITSSGTFITASSYCPDTSGYCFGSTSVSSSGYSLTADDFKRFCDNIVNEGGTVRATISVPLKVYNSI